MDLAGGRELIEQLADAAATLDGAVGDACVDAREAAADEARVALGGTQEIERPFGGREQLRHEQVAVLAALGERLVEDPSTQLELRLERGGQPLQVTLLGQREPPADVAVQLLEAGIRRQPAGGPRGRRARLIEARGVEPVLPQRARGRRCAP